jgi:hypothetical protein
MVNLSAMVRFLVFANGEHPQDFQPTS